MHRIRTVYWMLVGCLLGAAQLGAASMYRDKRISLLPSWVIVISQIKSLLMESRCLS